MTERLGVVGSGAIACGLAATAARESDVTLWTRSDAAATRAGATLAKACGKLEIDVSRVDIAVGLDGVEDRTFVIEAITEDAEVKCAMFGRLRGLLAPDAVLGTTTSSLPVGALAEASGRPRRFVGFHVFNPVVRMELVELAFPAQADVDTRARAVALCERLGKRAVEVPDTPGFVVNRLLFPYLFDAVRFAADSGMAPEAVDACMTLGAGQPMGPLALLDYVGLDIAQAIGGSLGVPVPEQIRGMVEAGRLGRKAGRGFYEYD